MMIGIEVRKTFEQRHARQRLWGPGDKKRFYGRVCIKNKKTFFSPDGFTLLELLIAVALSGMVMLAASRFTMTVLWNFNLQDRLSDMHLNANYTIERLSNEIMEAGSDLPDDNGYTVITPNGTDFNDITLNVNNYGMIQTFKSDVAGNVIIPVDDASGLLYTDALFKYEVSTGTVTACAIDRGQDAAPFTDGIDTTSEPNAVYLTAATAFAEGDVLYSCQTYRYFLNGNDLCLNATGGVVAEDIDFLEIKFFDIDSNPTTVWNDIRFARITVRARTAVPDRRYTHPDFGDGYRRVALSMEFRLRNKF